MKLKYKGYICKSDLLLKWHKDADLPEIFRTIAQLKKARPCWKECQIAQVWVLYGTTIVTKSR